MRRPRLAVAVQRAAGAAPPAKNLRRWAIAALADSGRSGEVTVRIVDEAESAALNERYRGKRGPTNVLAFPADPAAAALEEDLPPLGDLVICAPVVEREAREQGKPPAAHWAHIVVHGALHLAGFDHEAAADARIMAARERQVLENLGFPDPYEPSGA